MGLSFCKFRALHECVRVSLYLDPWNTRHCKGEMNTTCMPFSSTIFYQACVMPAALIDTCVGAALEADLSGGRPYFMRLKYEAQGIAYVCSLRREEEQALDNGRAKLLPGPPAATPQSSQQSAGGSSTATGHANQGAPPPVAPPLCPPSSASKSDATIDRTVATPCT